MKLQMKMKGVLFRVLPYDIFLKFMYRHLFKRKLNVQNPQKLTEKLFWLKGYNGEYNSQTIAECYDKYKARKYIANKLGTEEYLPKLYGLYEKAECINFDELPSRYVLKITQGCGVNIVNAGNLKENHQNIKKTLNKWMNETNKGDYIYESAAEAYCFDGKAKIICEEYLGEPSILTEKMFFCFNGKVEIMYTNFDYLDENGNFKKTWTRNVYDRDLNFVDVNMCVKNDGNKKLENNGNLQKMIEIAEKLSEGFPFVRVDMYDIKGKIVVGELTFIPHGGFLTIDPISYDDSWGELLELPKVQLNYKNIKKICMDHINKLRKSN